MAENVVVITATDLDAALRSLEGLDGVELRAAAIVSRDADGALSLDHEAGDALTFAEKHPRLGALVTLLLGPIDTLLFGNQLVALYGATEQSPEDLALRHIAQAVPAGSSALIAEVDEADPAVLDAAVPGTISRRPLSVVEAEIAAAQQP
ncbi:hypothetical protein [Pseudonocardia pini]|uniref:hypothetical protein n=1 Tax=Pseudonocardia pini TaxID=2758030 RepID=UPI0015F0A232|nr:hypothetical protein [Pseudonocardia pini]